MKNTKIWIAEDDEDDILFLKGAFAKINQENVRYFENGKLLVDYFQLSDEELPDLVLVDLNMPFLDGRGVINILRSKPDTKNIPLVVLSTSKDLRDIETVKILGANEFYSKPTTFDGLVDVLTTITTKWVHYD